MTVRFLGRRPSKRSRLPQQQQEKGLVQAKGSHGQQIRQGELTVDFSVLCQKRSTES